MRVTILTPSFLPAYNGMTFASLQHASMLAALGHQVSLAASCAPDNRASNAASLAALGVDFIPLDISGSGVLSRPVVGGIDDVVTAVMAGAPEVIVVEGRYFWGYHLIPMVKARGARIALISHGAAANHADWSVRRVLGSVAYGLYGLSHERRILRALDAVAVLSAHEDSGRFRDARLYRRSGLEPIVIGNTSLEEVAREVARSPRVSGRLRIAVVGDMSRSKNQWAAVPLAESNDSIAFVRFYYPEENDYSRRLMSKACDREIGNFERRVGLDRSGVMRSLVDIDLILSLSRTEAQPLSIVDGLACGVPFLSTPVGCLPSMKGGLVCAIPDMRGIIQRLAGDAAALDGLAREARSFFDVAHSESAVKPALAALLSAAMAGVRAAG